MHRVSLGLGVFLLAASPAVAQERSVWGFSGSVVPTWRMASQLSILFDAESVDISGGEFRAGIVRGRPTGGDWGVSFVRKTFKDDSQIVFEQPEQNCFRDGCFTESASGLLRNVKIDGIEAHRFFSFATIKRRAQIGLTLAGGVGAWKGGVLVDERFVDFQGSTPVPRHTVEEFPITQAYVLERSIVPLFRLELGAALIAHESFKVRVSGGVNFPGTQSISVSGIYLLPQ
jgi:hypothetical protein